MPEEDKNKPYTKITESNPNYFIAEVYDGKQETPRSRIRVHSISKLIKDLKALRLKKTN
jgi:hypothetical protein